MQLLGVLDVYLDSIGWNGGITTLRALAMNCPVVTLPGPVYERTSQFRHAGDDRHKRIDSEFTR